MKIPLVTAELFHADGRTDMRKLTIFANLRTRLKTKPKKKRDVCGHEIANITATKSSVTGMDFTGSRYRPVAGSYEYSNKPPGLINFDLLSR
jgi:hypothetical protein